MAFSATINSIIPTPDSTGINLTYAVQVTFLDDVSGFTSNKLYSFPLNSTQAAAVAQITKDGTALKTALASIGNLSAKVGSVITI
jgi:hypothetical protein